MFNKLWIRLALAFSLVTVIGVIIAIVLTNWQVGAQFRRFVVNNQIAESPLATGLTDYYAQHKSWRGVEMVFDTLPMPGMGPGQGGMGHGQGIGQGMRWGMPGGMMPNLLLADVTGQVIYDRGGQRRAGRLNWLEQNQAIPIESGGQTVGYLVVIPPGPPELNAPSQAFLGQVNLALLQAGLIAGVLGAILGLLIARGLSAPLGRFAAAARRIAQGQLDQRVPEAGSEEVANLARAFNEMAANLQQAETLRRHMVADIAHELRTPLTVIQGNLQAILDDVYPLDKAEIATLYDETLILNRLVNDLRELAQAEAGQLSLNLQPINLVSLVESAANLFTEPARAKNINLTITLPANLPPVQADPDRVRQVLHNLLSNAIRHTREGGAVTVTAEVSQGEESRKRGSEEQQNQESLPFQGERWEQRKISGQSSAVGGHGGFIRLTITDTGPGISPADLPHVFDRFWRADKARSREQGSSGLGLAIARQLVQAQGGQIGVESEGVPGKGSRFWFTLPYKIG